MSESFQCKVISETPIVGPTIFKQQRQRTRVRNGGEFGDFGG